MKKNIKIEEDCKSGRDTDAGRYLGAGKYSKRVNDVIVGMADDNWFDSGGKW